MATIELNIYDDEPAAPTPISRTQRVVTAVSAVVAVAVTGIFLGTTRKPDFAPNDPRCLVVAERLENVGPITHEEEAAAEADKTIANRWNSLSLGVEQMLIEKDWAQLAATVSKEAQPGGAYSSTRLLENNEWRVPKRDLAENGSLDPRDPMQHDQLGLLREGSALLLRDLGVLAVNEQGTAIPSIPPTILARLASELNRPELHMVAGWKLAEQGEMCSAQELFRAAQKHGYPEAYLSEAELLARYGHLEAARRVIDATPDRLFAEAAALPPGRDDVRAYWRVRQPGRTPLRDKWTVMTAIETQEWRADGTTERKSQPLDPHSLARAIDAHTQRIANYPNDTQSARLHAIEGRAELLSAAGKWREALASIASERPVAAVQYLLAKMARVGFRAAVDESGRVINLAAADTTVEAIKQYVIKHGVVDDSTVLTRTAFYRNAVSEGSRTGRRVEPWETYGARSLTQFLRGAGHCQTPSAQVEWCEANGLPTPDSSTVKLPDPARIDAVGGWKLPTPEVFTR